MDENTIQDLKQFISATVSQATSELATKDDLEKLEQKVGDVDLKLDTIADTLNQLADHEIRITNLEQQTA